MIICIWFFMFDLNNISAATGGQPPAAQFTLVIVYGP